MKLIENLNIYLKGKAVEALEKAPKVRLLLWGILTATFLYGMASLAVQLTIALQ